MERCYLFLLFSLSITSASAQYFQFSQYNFTRQRVNPAAAASSDYASASFLYRNQSTAGGFSLNSNVLSAMFPLMDRQGIRWAGLGVSFFDDRAGQAGIFNTQELALSYAVNIQLARNQSLLFGVNGLHSRRKVHLDGLYTGAQYIEGRGFDSAVGNAEPLGNLQNNFFTFSTGFLWQHIDRYGDAIASFGVSLFDINRPDDSFLGNESRYSSTWVTSARLRVYKRESLSFSPEILYSRNSGRNFVNAGVVTGYYLGSGDKNSHHRLDLITKYAIGRCAIAGLQFHGETISVGFTYDFPLLRTNVANTGTVEAGIELRQRVDRDSRRKRRNTKHQKSSLGKRTMQRPVNQSSPKPHGKNMRDSTVMDVKKARTMSERLKMKQDSIQGLATHGKLEHQPLLLDQTNLRFGFDFNQSALDEAARDYLDELAVALIDNRQLRIELTGHTDNVGSDKFNIQLSVQRAQTIKDALVERGVSADRIEVNGKGLREPLNNNSSDAERAENRRVEMKIYYAD